MTTRIPITFVEDLFDDDKGVWDEGTGRWLRKDLAPGSASWAEAYSEPGVVAALEFVCPCGCATTHAITIRREGHDVKHPSWEWTNKDRAKPTLKPSIQCNTPCKWHGFLTDGVFHP